MSTEADQRRMNIARQNSEIEAINDEMLRIERDMEFELIRRFSRTNINKNTKECYYCAENILHDAKVCSKCKRVFLEHALDVYQMEKKIMEGDVGQKQEDV